MSDSQNHGDPGRGKTTRAPEWANWSKWSRLDDSLGIAKHHDKGRPHQSTCSNIETRVDRPKSVVRVIRGVALCFRNISKFSLLFPTIVLSRSTLFVSKNRIEPEKSEGEKEKRRKKREKRVAFAALPALAWP